MTSILIAVLAAGWAVLAAAPPRASRLLAREASERRSARAGRGRRLVLSLAVAAAVWFAVASLGPTAVVVATGAAGVSYVVLGHLTSAAEVRRQEELAAGLPQVCDLLVACLEAGLPLRTAAGVLADGLDGPMADRLAEVAAKTRLGVADERAWAELGAEPALAALGRELARGAGSGTALAARVRALGQDARKEAFAAAEARAKKVGVQSVLPLMVCFLPAFILLGVFPIVGGLVLRFFTA